MVQTNNELYFAEDTLPASPQKHRSGKGRKVLSIISLILNVLVVTVTALRLIFLPLSLCGGVIVAIAGSFWVFLIALPLAMTIIVLPFLPIVIALAVLMLWLLAIVLEFLPIGLALAGLILSVAAGKKYSVVTGRTTVQTLSMVFGIVAMVLSVIAGIGCSISTTLTFVPLFVLAGLCIFYFVQMIVIAAGNSAV